MFSALFGKLKYLCRKLCFIAGLLPLLAEVHIKYISLGNLCIDKAAFRELIQNDFNADAVTGEVRRLMNDQEYRASMLRDYSEVREALGGAGASESVASIRLSRLRRTPSSWVSLKLSPTS